MGGRNALRYGYTEDTAPEGTRWMYNALAPKEGTQYGDILPVARDADGTVRVAMPNALREGLLGMADLLSGVDTGELTGRGAASVTMGGVGTAMGLAPRGAIGMGGSKPPIRAYHGSPHDFDKFSLSKIGTGEGAQAYGHGLYFAENEGVARGYRDALANFKLDGRPMNIGDADWHLAQTALKTYGLKQNDADSISSVFAEALKKGTDLQKVESDLLANYPPKESFRSASMNEAVRAVAAHARQFERNPGRMYEVAIHADPARFLDWDKPLSGQHPDIQRIARESFTPEAVARDIPGGTIYRGMLGAHDPPALASNFFNEAGIPGIRYLDAGSRTAGDGSRNYVVFDDNLIEILRKYGLLAPAPVAPPQGNALNPALAGNPLPNGLRRPEDREY